MRLQTPAFKNKKWAISWMLLLASALIAVDYFMAPVQVIKGWSMIRTEAGQGAVDCQGQLKQYYPDVICVKDLPPQLKARLHLQTRAYKGSLEINQADQHHNVIKTLTKIAWNLHQAELLAVATNNQKIEKIVLLEQSRNSLLLLQRR